MATGIYALISKERISDVLSTLNEFIDIPIQLIDTRGQVLQQYGRTTGYCARLKQTIFKPEECCGIHTKAGEHAKTLGEAYIFTCHADLSHIAFPLIHNNELIGTVIAGPFLMEKPDSTLVSGLLEKYTLTPELSIELLDLLSELSILPPNRVNVLKKLMDQLLYPLLPMERILLMQTREKMSYQSKINETIQLYKEQKTPSTHELFRQKENALMTKVRTGDINGAKKIMNELIAYIIYTDGASVDDFRVQAIELSAMISRVVLESGVSGDRIHRLQKDYISALIAEKKLDNMCTSMQEILENYMNTMYNGKDHANPYIRKALMYIASHYNEPLTITSVAETLKLSPNHFSALFQKVVGMKFHDYLCRVRVEESKLLLLSSDYSLTDIAVAMGFPDQSYFCKVFKKVVGLPPGQYRSK